MVLKLHSYFGSSASYRCRIALNLKGLPYELAFVHLVRLRRETTDVEVRRRIDEVIGKFDATRAIVPR